MQPNMAVDGFRLCVRIACTLPSDKNILSQDSMSAQTNAAGAIESIVPLRADASAITARIDRLPENRHTWWLVALLSLAGMFEVYDLFQTAYIPAGLVRSGIFSDGAKGLLGLPGRDWTGRRTRNARYLPRRNCSEAHARQSCGND